MKFNYDKNMLKFSVYIILTVISIYIGILLISNIGNIFNYLWSILSTFFSLIKPLIIAIVIAYLLFPIRNFFENILKNNKIYKLKKGSTRRTLAVILSYLLILGIIISLLCGIYFMIGGQLSNNTTLINIYTDVVDYFTNNNFSVASIKETIKELNIPFLDSLEPTLITIISKVQTYVVDNIDNMTNSIVSLGSSIVSFFIGLVISIYILKDSEYFVKLWKKLYNIIFKKGRIGNAISRYFKIGHEVFSKFIRGQLLEAFFVGVLSSIALSIVGIEYSVVIGIISGICNMIPYVGPITGTILAGIMALLSGNPIKIIYAVIAMIIVQQVDNNLLAPKIVGDSVGLHPVFTMLAILIGANVGGLFGMLLAVPIFATIRILFNLWYEKKFSS